MKATDEDELFDQEQYQSAVGSSMYISVAIRPEITYACSKPSLLPPNQETLDWCETNYAISERNCKFRPELQPRIVKPMYCIL